MSDNGLTYAIVTPVRNEEVNLRTLAGVIAAQELHPEAWVIVDTGSSDGTLAVAEDLAHTNDWIFLHQLSFNGGPVRGGPIVRAFHFGLEAVPAHCDVVVKLDADVTMQPDYFRRLLDEFARDKCLGISGGIGYERRRGGVWRQRHGTGAGVWGASRAYRRACLDDILPLEERMGWDTIDAVVAAIRGWDARVILDLPFLHHRSEGERDTSRLAFWSKQGHAAHYMGYRLSYLAVRTLYRAARDPRAIGIILGYLESVIKREPRCADASVREYVRQQQRLSRLPRRAREALRRRAPLRGSPELY